MNTKNTLSTSDLDEPQTRKKRLWFYILLFRNDALLKLGITGNSSARAQELRQVESSLEESYQVTASDNSLIRALENLAKSVCRELRSPNPLI
jgi:hypothetical protein